jgi:hypothetical protein
MIYAGLRLRHYLRESGQALLRHWQWLLLCGLLVPGSVLAVLAGPAAAIEALPQVGPGAIAVWLIAAAAWILPQRTAVRGDGFAAWAGALPLPIVVQVAADLVVLIAADVLLVPMLGMALMRNGPGLLVSLTPVLGLTLAAQWATVHLPLPSGHGVLRALPLPSAQRTSLGALAEKPLASGARIVMAWLTVAGAVALIGALGFDERALPVAVVALAVMAVMLAGLFRILDEARQPMAEWIATLPVGPWHAATQDTVTVLSLAFPPALGLLVWFGALDPAALLPLLVIVAAYCGLLAMLRPVVVRGGRFGVVVSSAIAAGWTGGALAMVLN